MAGCSVKGCTKRSEHGYIVLRFPRDCARRQLWAKNCSLSNYDSNKYYFICEIHFDIDQWECRREDGKKKLKQSAVPTIFLCQNLQKSPRKSSINGFLNSTLSLPTSSGPSCLSTYSYPTHLKLNRIIISDHNYASTKQFTPDNSALSLQNNAVITTNNNIKTTLSDNSIPKEDLLKQIDTLNSILLKRARIIRALRYKLNDINKTNNKIATKIRKQEVIYNIKLKKFLNENQISSLNYTNTKGFKWSNDTIKNALRLKSACGSNGYKELLAQNYPLPAVRTLRRRLREDFLQHEQNI